MDETDKVPALMECTSWEIYDGVIRNGDISCTLANSEEGTIAKVLGTELGPKKDLKKIVT